MTAPTKSTSPARKPPKKVTRSKAPASSKATPRRRKTSSTPKKAASKPRTRRTTKPKSGPPVPTPVISVDAEIVEVKEVSMARRVWRKSRAYVSWAVVVGLALLDPGLLLAAVFVSLLAAASFFCLGVIATTVTTVALLKQWFPEHLRNVDVTPRRRQS